MGFYAGDWQNEINVRDFIQKNYTPYEGDEAFLAPATERTRTLNGKFEALLAEELAKGGVLDIDTETVASLCNFEPGYLDRDNYVFITGRKKNVIIANNGKNVFPEELES